MDDLETRLRDELTRAADVPAPAAGLADRVVTRGRRTRRARAAGLAAAAVVVVVAAAGLLVPGVWQRDVQPATPVKGLPRVPLFTGQEIGVVVDWPGGQERRRPVGEQQPVASTPFGVLLTGSESLWLLGPGDPRPRRVLEGVTGGAAVSDDGRRVAVITGRTLQEVELPSMRVLRTLALTQPLVSADDAPRVVAYSGGALLLDVGEGSARRVLLVEAGPDEVATPLDPQDWAGTLGGAPADGGGPGGLGAFEVEGDARCRTEILRLTTGGGRWRLCREPFAGFSPDGRWVLATDATAEGLVVRDARTGKLKREWEAPNPLRAYGWEGDDAVLYTALDDEADTSVVRCVVSSGRCATVLTIPGVDLIPQPLPPRG